LDNLETIAAQALQALEAKNSVREAALKLSRQLIQHASRIIRATHREDWAEAEAGLVAAGEIAAQLRRQTLDDPDIYYTGYTQDAFKEFAEAHLTFALIKERPLPSPAMLEVEYPAYLNGLGEAAGELRRHVLDLIRRGDIARGERRLEDMDAIYTILMTMDYPDAITSGLRRTSDMVRGVVERTRGDLTTAAQHEKLQAALSEFEARINHNRK